MRSSRRGGRSDPVSSRPYRPGDDLRRLDRHASARLSAARDADELIVREHFAEEAARVAIVVDPSPTMALFPADLPWLHKPAAVEAAARLIEASAYDARSPSERHERPPAEIGSLALPRGAFVFVLSDFLAPPPEQVWLEALARSLDVIPVIIQDPIWEQSFPDVGGALLPLADPAGGRLRPVRLTRGEAAERRRLNEARLGATIGGFEAAGLDTVVLGDAVEEPILERFLSWAEGRRRAA